MWLFKVFVYMVKFFNWTRFLYIVKEKTLLRIALIASIIGVCVLFFVSDNIEISEKTIDNLDTIDMGEIVKVKGIVTKVRGTNETTFLELTQPESVKLIVFDNITILEGDFVEIIGKIDEYEGEKEIIVDRIRKIS